MIYVTGYRGNLGKVLVDSFLCHRTDCDVRSKESIRKAFINAKETDVLINCAAYTDVDECELEGRTEALHVNAAGIANLRDEFPGRIIHISTDYVFDGKDGPYYEDAEPSPINWYGQTKLCGEERFLEFNYTGDTIVRTTILYGGHKPDFANTVLRKLHADCEVEIPSNIYGNPTHVLHLAKGIMKVIQLTRSPKIVNIVGSETISRYEFAVMIANVFGYNPEHIIPIKNAPGVAKRPLRAGLKTNLAKRLHIPIFSVMDGLQQLFLEKGFVYGNK